MVLDPTLHGSVQEATGQKLIGESLKDVGRLEPSQRLPLENGIGGEDRVERHTFHFSLCPRVFFKMRRCSCYNLKTTEYFYGFYPIYWCSLPNWNTGFVLEGCRNYSWIGLVGQWDWRFVCQTTGNVGHWAGKLRVRAVFLKDFAECVRMTRRGWELDTEVSVRICYNLGIGWRKGD